MIIWLASYPRSGNTFLRIILNNVFNIKTYSIYDDKFDIAKDQKTKEVVGHEFLPENFQIEEARHDNKKYFIKTHEYPQNDEDKTIYIIRDGRESTLSYLKYHKEYNDQNKTLRDVIYGNIFIGSWGDHVKAWGARNRNNTLLLKFEEITNNPADTIPIISEFIDEKPINNKIPTFNELHALNPRFFRSGKINTWKSSFTENDHIAFWIKNYSQMLEYGYKSDMPDVINQAGSNVILFEQLSQELGYMLQQQIKLKENQDVKLNNLRKNITVVMEQCSEIIKLVRESDEK